VAGAVRDADDVDLVLHETPELEVARVDDPVDDTYLDDLDEAGAGADFDDESTGMVPVQVGPEEQVGPGGQVVPESGPLLSDAGLWEQRWSDVQASFVDDPGTSIHDADVLVTQAMEDLAKALIARRDTLQSRWRSTEAPPDTEELRLTIQGYRALLFGLLST
jgi:hypothetical protein